MQGETSNGKTWHTRLQTQFQSGQTEQNSWYFRAHSWHVVS